MQKLTGAYYTPKPIADFIVKYVLKHINSNKISILEPSAGEGVFIDSLIEHGIKGFKQKEITVLDTNKAVIEKIRQNKMVKHNFNKVHISDENFLIFQKNEIKKYSLVIGNPPYINKKLLSYESIALCEEVHRNANLSKNKINNIWTSFVVASVKLLDKNGILAFVLPSDLLQVKYAEEIRHFLQQHFNKIEIFNLKTADFPDIEQQTIILFGFKQSIEKGTFFYSVQNFIKNKYKKVSSNGLMICPSKWTHYHLTTKEIKLLNDITIDLPKTSDFVDVSAGIVTGANAYFIVTKDIIKQYNLSQYTLPILQKSTLCNSNIIFTQQDFEHIVTMGKPAFLLDLNNKLVKQQKLKNYLEMGVKKQIDRRYKCLLRKHWYCVPNIKVQPEAFIFKRIYRYPKLLENKANIFVTDSAYKIFCKDNCDLTSFIFSFYNIITLIYCEIMGRKYGGGVLELTPNEFKNLPIIYQVIDSNKYLKFQNNFNNTSGIIEYLSKHNETKLSDKQLKSLLNIYMKLIDNRLLDN